MAAYAYYLISIVSLVHGEVSVATQNVKYPTEVACLTAAIEASTHARPTSLCAATPVGPTSRP